MNVNSSKESKEGFGFHLFIYYLGGYLFIYFLLGLSGIHNTVLRAQENRKADKRLKIAL